METQTAKYGTQRVKGNESLVTVAAIQTNPRFGDKKYNLARQTELLAAAAGQGVQLAVLPELGNTGYMFNTRAEVSELAEEIPDGQTCETWGKLCARHKMYLCAGLPERAGRRFFNSSVLIGPDGVIGRYRKSHLWDEERLFFERGDLGFPVFHLPFGRVGLMICYDGWHPEVARILTLLGADVICDPACWVSVTERTGAENPVHPTIHMVHANLNGVYMVCADRCGTERGCTFVGNSCIAGPSGYVAGPASYEDEEVLAAEINVVRSRYRHWTDLVEPLTDRRTDLYDTLLGYKPAGITGIDEEVRGYEETSGHRGSN